MRSRAWWQRTTFFVSVSSHGLVRIPAPLQRQLEVAPGDKLKVYARSGRLFLSPLRTEHGTRLSRTSRSEVSKKAATYALESEAP
jgi:bifunctional DNA-binding transcriptional regulator/antitoxin component of YhaV-PrlF toxin-antitoxin module